jgi:hypothetical protein
MLSAINAVLDTLAKALVTETAPARLDYVSSG